MAGFQFQVCYEQWIIANKQNKYCIDTAGFCLVYLNRLNLKQMLLNKSGRRLFDQENNEKTQEALK